MADIELAKDWIVDGCRLALQADPQGAYHVLDGRPVGNGDVLELLLANGQAVRGSYEWSGVPARWPVLRVPLAVASAGEGAGRTSTAVVILHPDALLRWSPTH